MNILFCIIFYCVSLLSPSQLLAKESDEKFHKDLHILTSKSPYYFDDILFSKMEEYIKVNIAKNNSSRPSRTKHRAMLNKIKKIKLKHTKFNEKIQSKQCEPVDFRSEAIDEARDQGSIGWCFAYAAADLLSHELGKKLSAIDVAQLFHLSSGFEGSKSFIGGGNIKKAIELSIKEGVCLEKNFPSDSKYRYNANSKSLKLREVFLELEKLKGTYARRSIRGYTSSIIPTKYHYLVNSLLSDTLPIETSPLCDSFYLIREVFPQTNLTTVKNILELDTYEQYLNTLFKSQCSKKEIIDKKLSVKQKHFGRNEGIKTQFESLEDIDKILGTTNTKGKPVGINYDGSLMYIQNNVYKKVTHASTIVARKKSLSGECMYLIRNSWGRSFKRTDKDEAGHVWVSANEIMANVAQYFYFE